MTQQEKAKQDFETAHQKFKTTAQKMSEGLEKWIVSKGGVVDDEGNIIGLSTQNEGIADYKNAQLAVLLHFEQTTEAYLKALRQSLAEVTQANTLLKQGKSDENMSFVNDTQVKKTAKFYFEWRIQKTTTKQEFRRACTNVIKWTDEAIKRRLLGENEAAYLDKRDTAAKLLKDETLIKKYFDNRTKEFMQNDDSSTDFKTPTVTH